MFFPGKAKQEFNISPVVSADVDAVVDACVKAYQGRPNWLDDKNHIKTINFAKSVCEETARLATLGIKIQIDGSSRAEWLQAQIEKVYFNLRHWVEYGCACGMVVLKPNGDSVDLCAPGKFIITDTAAGEITGMVFLDQEDDEANKRYYTRLEYHRFLPNGVYAITNKCYVGSSKDDTSKEIPIEVSPWVGLLEEAFIAGLEKPLFSTLRTPSANNVDINSAVSLPIFAGAMEELKDLDIAYSRNAKEIDDSKRTILIDSDKLMPFAGGKVNMSAAGMRYNREQMGLPDMVKGVSGNGQDNFYQEINPTLNTDTRLVGINALLSQIGYKIGFSNGYFVFNESSGIQTATGVEAEQQRTVQFIKDVRDKLEDCMGGLIYALNAFADLYDYAPAGAYEVIYDFGDILYNREDDKIRWWGYVQAGKVPAWRYFVKFEGMTEEEARAMVEEAQPKGPTLFGGEE